MPRLTVSFPASLPQPPLFAVAYLLFLAVLFLLPLVIIPAAQDSFVLPKEALFQACAGAMAGLLLVGAAWGERLRIPLVPVNGVFALLIVWMALSILWSMSPALAWEHTFRMGMLFVFFLGAQSFLAGRRERLLWAAYAFMGSSFVLAVWLLVQDFRQAFVPGSVVVRAVLGDWRDGLSAVGLGNTGHIADFLVFGFLLWLAGALVVRGRWTKLLVLVALWLHAAGLIVSWSVHSNLSLIVGSLAFVYLLRFSMRGRWVRLRPMAIGAAAGWVAIVAFYVVDHPLNPHGSAVWGPQVERIYAAQGIAPPEEGFRGGIFGQAFASPRWKAGMATRQAIWLNTLDTIRERPWLGAGAGNFTYAYPAASSELVRSSPELARFAGSWTNAAHNTLLQYWSELGIVGVALLLLLAGAAVKGYLDRLRAAPSRGNAVILAAGMAALIAFGVQTLMNFPMQLPVSSLVFVMLLGVPHLVPPRGSEQHDMMMPVERGYGPLVLGVMMRNMARPVEFSFRLEREARPLAIGVAAAIVLVGGWTVWRSLVPLRADIAYRPAYDIRPRIDRGLASHEDALPALERALEIWPGHVNARSGYQGALLRLGRYEEAVEQTPKVLRKLNATEIYEHRAQALEALGRHEEAIADWNEIFRRNPERYAHSYPAQFQQWLQRESDRD